SCNYSYNPSHPHLPLQSLAPRARPAERYRLKYSRLRRAARALVFENGALCDEVARLEAKCLRARDERRFLLTRLLQLRALAGGEEASGEAGRRARRGATLGKKAFIVTNRGGGGGGEVTPNSRATPPCPPPVSYWMLW
uniref:INO80 complex subunit E N-terminal domain-containing protein n=1 Tax=Anser brachyrhynchus TaxID=132585 RepID=A0A8B9BL65_9AVES